MKKEEKNISPQCDCCGSSQWEYRFSESGFDLGRCANCGLHYISEMPSQQGRTAGMEHNLFADGQRGAKGHNEAELSRKKEFRHFCDLIRALAPPGKWLDIGCGTGTFIAVAMASGIEIEGIEPMLDRRTLACMLTGTTIHDRQIELLDLPSASFAAVTLTDVFSHLTSPSATLSCVHRILQPGGILLLHTSEIGDGVKKHHNYSWNLGDHRYYLGDRTIERYAHEIGFEVVFQEKTWVPDLLYSREMLLTRGRSALRNCIKKTCVYTPCVLRVIRWFMFTYRQKDNPHYVSTVLLRKQK